MGAKPTDGSPDDGGGTDLVSDALSLRAKVFVLGDEWIRTRVRPLVPDRVTTEEFVDADGLVGSLSGRVALVLVSAERPDDSIERIVRETLSTSQHARLLLVASDGLDLLQCEVPRDDGFVLPGQRDDLRRSIKRLYVRAYYSVAIERYYSTCLAIENHKRDPDHDADRLAELYAGRRRIRAYLGTFRQFLTTEDFEAIATREERFEDLVDSSGRRGNPSALGLPESCPDCGLDWTTWHGSRYETGYEMIGAHTYQCTRCGHTLADGDPDNYRIG